MKGGLRLYSVDDFFPGLKDIHVYDKNVNKESDSVDDEEIRWCQLEGSLILSYFFEAKYTGLYYW